MANDLRRNNVNAIWVPAILGDGESDGEIDRQLLAADGVTGGVVTIEI